MSPTDRLPFDTADDLRQYVQDNPGSYLVIAPETLDQIEAAEDAGGFEGGQSSGVSGGVSQEGDPGPDESSGNERAPVEVLDMEGAVRVGVFFEGVTETVMSLRDVVEAIKGAAVGPVLLVPTKELKRLIGEDVSDGA